MNTQALKTTLIRTASKVGFQLKKYSPEILIIAGVAGTVASTVMACRATTKLDPILEKAQDDISAINEGAERGVVKAKRDNEIVYVPYDETDHKKDLTIVYAQTGVKIAKLYAPAIGVGVFSLTCILASNNILRKRNVALAAAYAAVDRSFKEYKGRVIERFGEVVDRELTYGIKAKEVEKTVVDEETGEVKTVTETVNMMTKRPASPYAFLFGPGNDNWDDNADYNMLFLRSEQNYANNLLRTRGHLFLNDILWRLGIDKTPEGQIVGWVYKPEDEGYKGDGYIDFGIFNMSEERNRAFIEGNESSIWLNFNVDGNIHELMRKEGFYDKFTT